MELNTVIRVEVTQLPPALAAGGFGTILGIVYNPAFAARTKTYFNATEAATDYPQVQSAERRFLDAAFAQSSKPVKLGRANAKPTLQYKLSAISPVSFPTTEYRATVRFANTVAPISFTTDATPTDAEFATALVTALNAVPLKNYTASGAASPVTVVATNPGDFFSIEITQLHMVDVKIDHVDPDISSDLDAIFAEDPAFDVVIPTQSSADMDAAVYAWALPNNKIALFDVVDSKAVTDALGGAVDDPIEQLKVAGNRLASGWFHTNPSAMLAVSIAAKVLPTDPGSETWAYKQLDGVSPVLLTEGQFQNLKDKYGNTYVAMGSGTNAVRITWDGRTGSGSYLDLQRGILWFVSLIQTDVFNFFSAASAAGKIGFDAEGRAALKAVYRAACKKAVRRGFIAPDEFTVTMLALADVPDADRQNRHYPDTEISFRALGAMHSADVSIVMKV